ncbi:uncharacterized protein [Pyrus communis]|uniref:uncharacterized protein n=1 Tax=Pyrus communis TaxID=23211 RepID=UPI0035C18241
MAHKNKWDEECVKAFQDLKQYLTSLPLLFKPEASKNWYIYMAVSEVVVSFALIRKEIGAQLSVFYTSKALIDAKTRYRKIEKLILALVVAARKLKPYFQSNKGPGIGRLRSRIHLKPKRRSNSAKSTTEVAKNVIAAPAPPIGDFWHLHINGSSNYQGSGASLVLTTPDGSMLEQAITLSFKVSNNKAKYEALLAGLRLVNDLVVKMLMNYSDSQLITNQTLREYVAKHPKMARYLKKVREQLATFQAYTFTQVLRAENVHADALAGLGLALNHQLMHSIPVKYLEKPSIDKEPVVEDAQINTTPS